MEGFKTRSFAHAVTTRPHHASKIIWVTALTCPGVAFADVSGSHQADGTNNAIRFVGFVLAVAAVIAAVLPIDDPAIAKVPRVGFILLCLAGCILITVREVFMAFAA